MIAAAETAMQTSIIIFLFAVVILFDGEKGIDGCLITPIDEFSKILSEISG